MRKAVQLFLIPLIVALIIGCVTTKQKPTKYPLTVKDDKGRTVSLRREPKSIVSLAPDNTEILFALGLGDRVRGVTAFCNYPEEAKKKPKIGDLMNPNIEKIITLKPDLVLATGGIQDSIVGQLNGVGIPVFISFPDSYQGVIADIAAIGKITNRAEIAGKIVKSMTMKRDQIIVKVKRANRPKVFYEVYKEPLMTAGSGTFINDLIMIAGGENIAGGSKKQYPEFSLEMLVAQNPDVYLASNGTMGDTGELKGRPGWEKIKAVENKKVFILDQDVISRGGPRLAGALETVAKAIHPEQFLGD